MLSAATQLHITGNGDRKLQVRKQEPELTLQDENKINKKGSLKEVLRKTNGSTDN